MGFVVSKKIGNAVVRNRVTRRLREIVRPHLETLPAGGRDRRGRAPGIEARPFAELREDVDSALASAFRKLARREERSR
ncbi:ribonuclease P protein component [Brachybacterium sp. GPGPB12]|uniref:ribonuclease P protein component n=1 Tax=Brachybacterium sp. GPGPB12 TaxID=3023517 RepID=UPI00313455EC